MGATIRNLKDDFEPTNLESYNQRQPTVGSFQSLLNVVLILMNHGSLIHYSIIVPEAPVPTIKLRVRTTDSEVVKASKRAAKIAKILNK